MKMMAHSQEPSEPQKRKRDVDDNGAHTAHTDRIPQPPPPQSGNSTPINYLSKVSPQKLKLIQGDGEAFADVLALISEYEGVLSRHESLASCLGAKLTGPRLVKAMEGVFEGSITVLPHLPNSHYPNQTLPSIAWLDIVQFAKANPNDLQLVNTPENGRMCQFVLKGAQVQITEDDWRLIMSGAIDRFRLAPPHPLEEDENAELATLDIVESRLHGLIKKADEVARKARQLNYHLSGRKASISSKRTSSHAVANGFPPTSQPRAGYDLHADLLQQFLQAPAPSSAPRSSVNSIPSPTTPAVAPPNGIASTANGTMNGGRPATNRLSPGSHTDAAFFRDYAHDDPYRPLITARVEKLNKGDVIYPSCDRCRRLKTQCVKHLTACSGCTKKHAKCSWKALPEDEIAWLKGETGSHGVGGPASGRVPSVEATDMDGDDSGSNVSAGGAPPAPGSLAPQYPTSDQHSGVGTPTYVKSYRRSPPRHPSSTMHGFSLRDEGPPRDNRRDPFRVGGYEPMETDYPDHRGGAYDHRDRDYRNGVSSERRGSTSGNGRSDFADELPNDIGGRSSASGQQRDLPLSLREHSLLSLSHVASIATAAAEARDSRSLQGQSHSASRRSSSNGGPD